MTRTATIDGHYAVDQTPLANGATMIAASPWRWGSYAKGETLQYRYVLAYRSDHQFHPYATWCQYRHTTRPDEAGYTEHGNYFEDVVAAALDLKKRAGIVQGPVVK